MTTQSREKQVTDAETQDRLQLHATIGKYVLHTLGKPEQLHTVQVRQLWEGHYRVNILTGPDAASLKVAHSYFLETDRDGNVLACTPSLTRQYPG
jgi:hypothetical protein